MIILKENFTLYAPFFSLEFRLEDPFSSRLETSLCTQWWSSYFSVLCMVVYYVFVARISIFENLDVILNFEVFFFLNVVVYSFVVFVNLDVYS